MHSIGYKCKLENRMWHVTYILFVHVLVSTSTPKIINSQQVAPMKIGKTLHAATDPVTTQVGFAVPKSNRLVDLCHYKQICVDRQTDARTHRRPMNASAIA